MALTLEEALNFLSANSCSAVILGTALLDARIDELTVQVAQRHPHIPRFLRSEHAEGSPGALGIPSTYPIPQDPKPAEWEAIITRMALVHRWLEKGATRQLLSHLRRLPTIPKVYQQVVAALQSPDTSFESVAEMIAQDPIMTAKLLQVVNAACFAQPTPITRAVEAVMLLGTERVKGLILVAHVFSEFESARASGLALDEMWRHSMQVGAFAQTIAQSEMQNVRHAEMAFTAGMLHDVGKLLLAANLPTEYRCAIEESHQNRIPLHQAEESVFSASHSEIGGVMLGMWGLPVEIVRAVGWHHSPQSAGDTEFSVLTAVHAANVLAKTAKGAAVEAAFKSEFDVEYLRGTGLEFHRNHWRELCGCKRDPAEDSPEEVRSQRRMASGN